MKKITVYLVLLLLPLVLAAQNESFVLYGFTLSFVHGTPGTDYDIFIAKVDGSGNKMWRRNYGGSEYDSGGFAMQTADGGFLSVGTTFSFVHGTQGVDRDGLVYKLDADGKLQWRKNLGGDMPDSLGHAIETADGGYLVVGETESYVHGPPGMDKDFLVYKLDAAGNKLWRKNLGGYYGDLGRYGFQCVDGGYLILGWTLTYVNGSPGSDLDILVYKLDASGNKQWRKNYGGAFMDQLLYAFEDAAGNYWMSAFSQSYVHGVPGTDFDVLVYKIDASGNKLWRKNYGGGDSEVGVAWESEGGDTYIRAQTQSYIHGTPGTDTDFLVYKIDASGNKIWRKNWGGDRPESSPYLKELESGGYLVSGTTSSFVHGTPPFDQDMVIYHLDASLSKQWRKNYGGDHPDMRGRVELLGNGDLLLWGATRTYVHGTPGSDQDILLYRLDVNGNKLWRKNYGGVYNEDIYTLFVIE